MKVSLALLLVLAGAVALLLLVPHVSATSNCGLPVANRCHGFSAVATTTGGVTSGRCFALRATNTAPVCSTAGIITTTNDAWQMDAGSCITVYWFDVANGALPPSAPNKVGIKLAFDATASIIRTIQANTVAEPGAGSTFNFCATSDGTSSGSARAGTYYLEIQAIKDNAVPSTGNYNIFSGGTASVGAISSYDAGGFVGRIQVASIARNAYPAGSTYAYGPSGDESITLTATFTTPNGDANVETARDGTFDSATHAVTLPGSTVDVDSTTLVQSGTADNSFPTANNPWQGYFEIIGNSVLLGEPWTTMAASGHGANIATIGTTIAYDTTTFNVDSRIRMDSDGTGGFATADETDRSYVGATCSGTQVDLFNRGESACTAWSLVNARGEYLTRSMTFARRDTANTVCASYGSLTPTSGVYSVAGSFSTSTTCIAANDATGTARHLLVTNTDQSYVSGTIYRISSLYFIDSHIQISATLNKDNYPTENANEDTAYIISTAVTDTTHGWCHVVGVRKDVDIDTSGSVLTWSYIDPTSTTRFTGTTDTGSDGWTATHLDLLASTPLGTWTFRCTSASFNGNTGTNDQTFTVSVPAGGGFVGDPLRASCTPNLANPSETVTCAAAESNSDGSARTGNAAGTLYDLWNPSNTQIVTGGATTEIGTTGIYRFTYSPGASPSLGNYIVVVRTTDASPVTTQATFTIETDPTIALANSLATALVDTGLIKGYTDQVEGYTDTLEASASSAATDLTTIKGYTDTVEGSLATAATSHATIEGYTDTLEAGQAHADAHHHTIEGYTDTLEAGQASAATQVSGVATQVSGVQTSINTVITNQGTAATTAAANLATILAEFESSETAMDLLQNYTTQQILDALNSMNVTFTGNFTTDTAALGNLSTELHAHRQASMEIFGMDFNGATFAQYLIAASWLVAMIWCFTKGKLLAGTVAAVGAVAVFLISASWTLPAIVVLFVTAIFLEAFARERIYSRFITPSSRNDDT